MSDELHGTDAQGNVLPPGMFVRNGIYYVRAQRGTRRKASTGKRDFKSALRRYHEIMREWNDGESGWTQRVPTLRDYWTKEYRPAWTQGHKTPLPGSDPPKYRDDQLMQVALADLGAERLDRITSSVAQRWTNARRRMTYQKQKDGPLRTLSEGTVSREVSLLQAVFQKAVNDRLIKTNPWVAVERESYVTRERVLTRDEQAKLEAVLSPRYKRWMLFMLGTGLRLEECRGIREADDLHFVERWVRVTRKSRGLRKKVQQVPLLDGVLLDILQEQLTELGQLWHQNPQSFRKVLDKAAKDAGIDHVSPHTLRHTFATRYLQGGGDIYVLSQLLGHSSVGITERVYAHLLHEDLRARSAHVDLGIAPKEPGKVVAFKREA